MLAGEVIGDGGGARGRVKVRGNAWSKRLVWWKGDGGENGEQGADGEEDGIDEKVVGRRFGP